MAKSQAAIIQTPSYQPWLVGLLVLLVYAPSFIWMWERWFARDSYYSHGLLIPLISVFLIWQKRDVLKNIVPQSSPWGLKLFFASIALQLFSALFRVYFTSGFSLIFMLYALVLHFYGTRALKELFFPISFLIFMVPLPLVVITNLSFRLKILAAQLAVVALNHMGLVCVQHGSAIVMRHAYVVVEDVCSGLRSLITLMALGSLFAYGMKSPWPKKLALFACTIPIAVITNILRIIFLASVGEIWGVPYATGPIHEISGFIVFFGAFCLLAAAQRMIE